MVPKAADDRHRSAGRRAEGDSTINRAPDHLVLLDVLRAVSALLVAVGHVRGFFFESIQKVDDSNPLTLAFYLVTSLQHEAVVVFFVISGYLVGGPVVERVLRRQFDPLAYFLHRFARIYIVLIPSIALAAILAFAGLTLFADTRFYAPGPLFPSGFDTVWTWRQVPCHLLSVQGIVCRAFDFSPTLWSLGHEWLYYMAFPVLVLALLLPRRRWAGAVLFGGLVVALWSVFPRATFWLTWPLYWVLGAASACVFRRWPVPAGPALLAAGLALAAFPVSRIGVVPLKVTDFAIAAGLAVALASPFVFRFRVLPRLSAWSAGFSYSLYAIHVPVGVFVAAALSGWLSSADLAPPGAGPFAAFALVMAAVILAAKGFAAVTEDRTDAFRRWLETRLRRSGPERAAKPDVR